MKKKYHKGNRLWSAFHFSKDGIKAAWKDEAAFRQVIIVGIMGIIASFFLPLTVVERILWIMPVLVSWIVELLNSAIENVVDLCSPELNPFAKKAKDMGSAAQLMACFFIVMVWGSLLWQLYCR